MGNIEIKVNVTDEESEIDRVEVYIDKKLKKIDTIEPYSWRWIESSPFKFQYTINIVAYDNKQNIAEKEIKVLKFFNYKSDNETTF